MKNKGTEFIKGYLEDPQAKKHSSFREVFRQFLDTDPVGQQWLQEVRNLRKRPAQEVTAEPGDLPHPVQDTVNKLKPHASR